MVSAPNLIEVIKMRKHLTSAKILNSADYKDVGIRRWDISNQIALFYSAHEDWHDGPVLWAYKWCIHLYWPDKEHPYVSIPIQREYAWNLLIAKHGKWQ